MTRGGAAFRVGIVLLALALAHFGLRPRLGDPRFAPDFVLLALLVFAMRARPGAGAAAGLLVGLATDATQPTAFGAAALACTLVGYAAGWVRTVFVAENQLVNALFVLGAAWARDVIQVVASQQLTGGGMAWQLLVISPAAALATAAAALVTLLVAGRWLSVRASP